MSISLTAQMTANLLSLQGTAKLMGITQERLATGKKVNSAIDDPVAFFDADAHYQLANDYAALKNGMSEGIQTLKAAADTIESIKSVLQQMKSVASSVASATTDDEVASLTLQYNELALQITSLAGDAVYKGINLLADANTLTIKFNNNGDTPGQLAIDGVASDATGLSIADAAWAVVGDSAADNITAIDAAINALRSTAKTFASNLSIVTTRQDFTDKMIATLKIGGDNLTLADMNEEGANMLMLQTRQALGIQSLSMASQSAQQVLQLFQ
jgi:flagellin